MEFELRLAAGEFSWRRGVEVLVLRGAEFSCGLLATPWQFRWGWG